MKIDPDRSIEAWSDFILHGRHQINKTSQYRKRKNMELEFEKSAKTGNFIASGDNGKYIISQGDDKRFSVKCGKEEIASGLKTFALAVKAANAHDESDDEDDEEETPPAKTNGKTVTAGKTITASRNTTSAAKIPPAKKVKPFPEYDENYETHPGPKGRKETTEAYAIRLRTGKMQWGRKRAAYERENGLAPAKETTSRAANGASEPRDYGDREGITRWNNWDKPDALECAYAQLLNARSSRDYAKVMGGLHAYSTENNINPWQRSYFAAVERCYKLEAVFETLAETLGVDLSTDKRFKNYEAEYYGLNITDMDEDEQEVLKAFPEILEQDMENRHKQTGTKKPYVHDPDTAVFTAGKAGTVVYPMAPFFAKRRNGKK